MSDWTRAMEDEAIAWLIGQRDERFDDWTGFEAWLSADPAHPRAYAAMAADDRDLDEMLPAISWPVEEYPDDAPVAPTRRYWLGGGIAAALALTVATWTLLPARDLYSVQTAAGERRTIQLAGSRVDLNGDTRVMLDRGDPRYAQLDHGQAVFVVKHDAARPFRVDTAGASLVDAGTTFEVTSDAGNLDVAVSEGLVLVDPDKDTTRVAAGQRLVRARGQKGDVTAVRPSDVGAWRDGQLFYDGASLSRVAADLQRNLGVRVTVSDGAAQRSFRGVVRLDGGADATMARLGILLGVTVRRSGDGWMVSGP
jgi:transmembrane sensor